MTLTPKQLAEEVTKEETQTVKRLETVIDRALREDYIPGGDVCFGDLPENVTGGRLQRVLNRIKAMYGEAGWNVQYESDQRDGDYLRFSAKRSGGERR